LSLTRKGSTENRARQILFEALPFLTDDPKPGIIAYLSWCKEQGNCNRTLSNKLIRIGAFYHAMFSIEPKTLRVPKPTFVTRMPQIYATEDLSLFFGACNAKQKLYFKTLLCGGLRMQEARYLEFSDLEDGFICVKAKPEYGWTPKTSEERRIPVPKSLTTELLAIKESNALVFPTAKGQPDYHTLRTAKRIAKRAGLDPKKWSLHGFRRTCLTRLVNSGNLGLPTVMAIAGHRDTKSALRYQRPLDGDVLQAKIENMWI
jgi:integrase